MANSRTRATANWQAKVGLVACTYKLKTEIASAFREACANAGESQAAALTRLMQEYMERDAKREKEREEKGENSLFPTAEPPAGTSQAKKEKQPLTVDVIKEWARLNDEERLSAAKIAKSPAGMGWGETSIKDRIREYRKKGMAINAST